MSPQRYNYFPNFAFFYKNFFLKKTTDYRNPLLIFHLS